MYLKHIPFAEAAKMNILLKKAIYCIIRIIILSYFPKPKLKKQKINKINKLILFLSYNATQ